MTPIVQNDIQKTLFCHSNEIPQQQRFFTSFRMTPIVQNDIQKTLFCHSEEPVSLGDEESLSANQLQLKSSHPEFVDSINAIFFFRTQPFSNLAHLSQTEINLGSSL